MTRVAILLIIVASLCAQQMPPSPVGFTEARQQRVEGELALPGTVESNVVSLVASEIGGLVVEYPVKQGDQVKQGQLLARLNKRATELDIVAIEARLREAEARQKLAERNHERSKELFDSKVFSQQQLDDTFFESSAWQGTIDNLKAEMERLRYDVERSVIVAPFDGVVITKHTEVGQWLGVGDEVLELLSLEQLEIRVDTPERYYPSVRLGAPARISFEAMPDRNFSGTINAIIPQADEQARTFPIKIRFASNSAKIGVGMLAQVRLPGVSPGQRGSRTATIVPKDAIVRQGPQLLVWLINDEGGVQPAPVQTGTGLGDWIEVNGPVTPGAKVVTRGNERLRPGQEVRGEPIEYKLP